MSSEQLRELLSQCVDPIEISPGIRISELLERMGKLSFQAKNLSLAFKLWLRMLQENCIIMLGLAGAMIPAGMRKLICFLIQNRFLDCIVTTGANIFHDLYESLGGKHYRGSPQVDDELLRYHGINRIYDIYALELGFRRVDRFLLEFCESLANSEFRGCTREFLYLLGSKLRAIQAQPGMLSIACESGVPIYSPAIADSSIGLAMAQLRLQGSKQIMLDLGKDSAELYRIFMAGDTGVIFVAGGVPKNFIQQIPLTLMEHSKAHKYAIQITQDLPVWGGLSGASLEEAKSWGKLSGDSVRVTVHAEASLVLPILVTGLAEAGLELAESRIKPRFDLASPELRIEF